jgi:hypothetical protein
MVSEPAMPSTKTAASLWLSEGVNSQFASNGTSNTNLVVFMLGSLPRGSWCEDMMAEEVIGFKSRA